MTDFNTLEFDPSGTVEANRFEVAFSITPPIGDNFSFVIPGQTPFFTEDVELIYTDSEGTSEPLVYGVDYIWAFQFREASKATTKQVWAGISFIRRDLDGQCVFLTNWLGGDWVVSEAQIAQILAGVVTNPRVITWDQVADLPYKFPYISFQWDVLNMVGQDEVVSALMTIAQVIANANPDQNGNGVSGDHILSRSNPHGVTKAQVELGNVPNMGLALTTDIDLSTVDQNNGFMTPYLVKYSIGKFVPTIVSTAISTMLESLSPSSVGLDSVPNMNIATSEELAELSTNGFMTPYLTDTMINSSLADVYQQIAAINSKDITDFGGYTASEIDGALSILNELINSHASASGNTHNLTLADMGIDWLTNLNVGTVEDVQANTSNKLITAVVLNQILSDLGISPDSTLQQTLLAHINSEGNVHNLTASDINVYEKEEVDTLLTNSLNSSNSYTNDKVSNLITKLDYEESFDNLTCSIQESTLRIQGYSVFDVESVTKPAARAIDHIIDVGTYSSLGHYYVLFDDNGGSTYLYSYIDAVWVDIQLPTTGGNITKIEGTDNILILGTDTGEIYTSSDNGVTWGLVATLTEAINFIDTQKPNNCIIVTDNTISISNDDLATITDVTPVILADTIISASITDINIIVLTSTQLLIADNSGSGWTLVDPGIASPYVSSVSENSDKLMVSNSLGDISLFKSNLNSWDVIANLTVTTTPYILGVNANGYYIAHNSKKILKSYDDGITWGTDRLLTDVTISKTIYNDDSWMVLLSDGSALTKV